MPDLTIISMQQCESSAGPKTANVGGYNQSGLFCETTWPHCTCLAYKFNKKRVNFGGSEVSAGCKHIDQAERETCQYHEQTHGAPSENGVCPLCGGNTVTVRVGV